MLSFVLCDDQLSSINRLSQILESVFISYNIDAQIDFKSNNPNEILKYINNNHADVLFLDIDLKSDINGLELAKIIRNNNKSIYIIYTTGHMEFVMLAYKTKAFDYLVKPISQGKVEETVLRLLDDMKTSLKSYIKLNGNNSFLNPNNINFIRKDGMKTIFYSDTSRYETYNSFNKIQSCLPENFVRCHKSYMVNVNKISNIISNTVIFDNNEICDIGPKYKRNLMEVINNYGHTK